MNSRGYFIFNGFRSSDYGVLISGDQTFNAPARDIDEIEIPGRDGVLTLDNGREFAGHERIALRSQCQVFFADPYSSWQRGTNENTNGLLRQYFPKGSDFSKLTVEAVNRTVARINLRPRKRLGWKTPYEVHTGVSVALMC